MVTAVLVLLLPVVILPVLLLRLGILPVFLRWRLLSFHLLFVLVFGGGGKAGGVLSLSESSLNYSGTAVVVIVAGRVVHFPRTTRKRIHGCAQDIVEIARKLGMKKVTTKMTTLY